VGFVADLLYFGPHLGWRRGAELLLAKGRKALRRRRVAGELRRGSSDRDLLTRLRLPEARDDRLRALREAWEPLAPLLEPARPGAPEVEPLLARARAVRDGRQVLFGREVEVGWPPRWSWRWDGMPEAGDFSEDVRSTWELQRLQGVLPLAWGARLGEARDVEEFSGAYLTALLDFLRVHPGPDGLAWESALELGLRLIALVQGLPLVVSTRAFADNDLAVLHLLDRHARWLAADLSLDKVVRGNHLLGELAGLLAVGHLLPTAREAWWGNRDVQALLEEEILQQFHPDGVSVEQSLPYEKFILEFLLVAGLLSRERGRPLSSTVAERLRFAAGHLEAVTAPDGTLPPVGDNDSGRGALLPPQEDPRRPGDLSARLRALLGDAVEGDASAVAGGGSRLSVQVFPEGGHAVARSAGGDFLFLRGGPFGWGIPGPASHSHADWLAPVLFVGGEAVLVDPGVYGYRVGRARRDAFRVWEGHSAVQFQPSRGPHPDDTFRWRDLAAEAHLEAVGTEGEPGLAGRVGWGRGPKALLWHRSVLYNELDASWLFLDRLSGASTGPTTWVYHFAPGIRVEPLPEREAVRLVLPSGRELLLQAEPETQDRWEEARVAPAYGRIQMGPVLRRRFPSPPEGVRLRITPLRGAGSIP